MSEFSHALTQEIEQSGKNQLDWALLSGLSQSIISRYCSGRNKPDPESMEKLCSALDPGVRVRLVEAHLRDELPKSARPLIRIASNSGNVKEDAPTPQEIQKLDSKTRKAILYIARLALGDKEAQDALQSTARFLGCKI